MEVKTGAEVFFRGDEVEENDLSPVEDETGLKAWGKIVKGEREMREVAEMELQSRLELQCLTALLVSWWQ